MPAISVITPIYNVKEFVRKCAEHLMSQTFKDVEFIFIDDASTDGSISILEDVVSLYPERNVRILHHDVNKGLPASRQTGINAAIGEYVFNCDGDDWMEDTMLEKMYESAKANDSDYVYCDFYLSYTNSERYMKSPLFSTPDEMLRLGFLCGAAKYNVWNKLIKKSMYEGVIFPVDHKKGGEDMIMISMLSKAKTLSYVPEALYHYVKTNTSAISETFSQQRLIDIKYNASSAIKILEDTYPFDLSKEIAFFKLNVKLPFLITDDKSKYVIWRDWFPEANKYVLSNPILPVRTKVLQFFASKNLWPIVRLYYIVCYKIIYSIIYK